MSISLSQKIQPDMPLYQRAVVGFGITDEIYALSITEVRKVTFRYMIGLILLPFLGWTLGTAAGVYLTDIMPIKLINAMGIALYAMFIAIIVPDAKKNYKIALVILIAIIISCIFYYVPYIKNIGLGFKIIISTSIASLIGAFLFPIEDNKKEEDKEDDLECIQ
jgi:predicted branched-subunit amino acid permease